MDTSKPTAFVSYVREDTNVVERLATDLRQEKIDVWLDRTDLAPGEPWKPALQRMIIMGSVFVACFSLNYERRRKTYMNDELTFATTIRYFEGQLGWLVPVLLTRSKIPSIRVSPTVMLADLEVIDLSLDWNRGIGRLAKAIRNAHKQNIPSRIARYRDYPQRWHLRSWALSDLRDQDATKMILEEYFFERDVNPEPDAGSMSTLMFFHNSSESVALDLSSGLLWSLHDSGLMLRTQVEKYMAGLNRSRYAGVNRWRLPTLPEAISLIPVGNKFYDYRWGRQLSVWTADRCDRDQNWGVSYALGSTGRLNDHWELSVRAVCSW